MSKRAHLYSLVREMRRYLAWQVASGAPGLVPATPGERESFEARKQALEEARAAALRERLRGGLSTAETSEVGARSASSVPQGPTPEPRADARKLPEVAAGIDVSASASSGKSISASTPLWKGQPAMYQMRQRRKEMQEKKRLAAREERRSFPPQSGLDPARPRSRATPSAGPRNARPPRTEPYEPAVEYDEDVYLQGRPASGPAPGPEDEEYATAPLRAAKPAPNEMSPQEKMDFLADYLSDCRRCGLCESRQKVVLGSGDPQANLLFLGHAPGAAEDREGLPFVGAGGELLTKMIQAMELTREKVYLANLVKCKPPSGRMPGSDEVRTCLPFLKKQIQVLNPRVIVTLGEEATAMLLGDERRRGQSRGEWQSFEDIGVMPTYHPDFLVHHQSNRKYRGEAWSDLQKVMERLGIE